MSYPSAASALNNGSANGLRARLHRAFSWLGPYTLLLQFALIALLLMTGVRLLLVIWQYERVNNMHFFPDIFLHGLRADLIQIGLFLIVPVVLAPLFAWQKTWPVWKWLVFLWTAVAIVIIALLEISTPTFITQYDLRPNRLFIEYLAYPKEVFAMLWNGFRAVFIFGVLAIALLAWGYYRMARSWLASAPTWPWQRTLWTWPLITLIVFAAVRSTTDHRPANPAMFALTSDAMVNSLTINSTWSVINAVYSLKDEEDAAAIYGSLAEEEILRVVRSSPWLAGSQYPYQQYPTVHYHTTNNKREKPLNIVIVLEESLGATFVQSLGGVPVTPNLERLKQEGWWFERLFATGTRSVRGIEAVVSGFPPSPARSVVKLARSQHHFYTLADELARHGYQTEFVYGGAAHFDNMRGFFAGNGFTNIVDESSYEDPEFVGSWGVSDEDLFTKADARLQQLHAQGQPFFSLIFSSSNHEPFEYPDGKIKPYDAKKATVNNAVEYADFALGEFIDTAKSRDYWQDTVFLIVADHDNRVYGNDLVPVKKFHIPGLILGGTVSPRTITDLASQIDLAPTLLSLAGISGETPLLGHDLSETGDGFEGRAMMQFDNNYAWLEGEHLIVLRPQQPPLAGVYDYRTGKVSYSKNAPDAKQVQKALAHVLLPSLLYRQGSYYVPLTTAATPVVK